MSDTSLSITGNVRATMVDLETGETKVWNSQNLITLSGLVLMRDFLAASTRFAAGVVLVSGAPLPPTYIALGSGYNGGSWQANRYMAQVPGEHFRGAISSRDSSGQGVAYHAFFGSADADGPDGTGMTIGAYGIYAGRASDAPGAAGGGILFAVAREPVPFAKKISNTLSLDWTVTISGKL